MNWDPAFLNRRVAMKLITGHMMQMIMREMARVINTGRSSGVTRRKASLWASLSTMKNSRMKATGHMMTISWKAMRKTAVVIPPMFKEML